MRNREKKRNNITNPNDKYSFFMRSFLVMERGKRTVIDIYKFYIIHTKGEWNRF